MFGFGTTPCGCQGTKSIAICHFTHFEKNKQHKFKFNFSKDSQNVFHFVRHTFLTKPVLINREWEIGKKYACQAIFNPGPGLWWYYVSIFPIWKAWENTLSTFRRNTVKYNQNRLRRRTIQIWHGNREEETFEKWKKLCLPCLYFAQLMQKSSR